LKAMPKKSTKPTMAIRAIMELTASNWYWRW
jgi:hypothetical protein